MADEGSQRLLEHLLSKGVIFRDEDKESFKNSDYFQVVNGYKRLFVERCETIDEMIDNIDKGIDIERYSNEFSAGDVRDPLILKESIVDQIYARRCPDGIRLTLEEKKKDISDTRFKHHVYISGSTFADFRRMFDFEHELRAVLLKYVLVIEDSIKRIFISYLNDNDRPEDYLLDIKNYKRPANGRDFGIQSLKKVLDILGNNKSAPIKRKNEQGLPAPYWVVINEMTLNQTFETIKNLKEDDSNKIFESILRAFTPFEEEIDSELARAFQNAIHYLAEFRNVLAHNAPVYSYNVSYDSFGATKDPVYEVPKPQKPSGSGDDQDKICAIFLSHIAKLYGADTYNSGGNAVHINLSMMIYLLSRIMKRLRPDTNFGNEVRSIYLKYKIIITNSDELFINGKNIEPLLSALDELRSAYEHAQEAPNEKETSTRNDGLVKAVSETLKEYKKLKCPAGMPRYGSFIRTDNYKKYTGVTDSLLKII